MGELSPVHLLIVLVVALVILGPSRLPELGATLGRTLREFRGAIGETTDAFKTGVDTPAPPATPRAADPSKPSTGSDRPGD